MKGILTLIVCSMLGTGVAGAGTALDGLTKMAGELRSAASPQGDGSEQKVPAPAAVEAAAAETPAPNLDSLRAEIARLTAKFNTAMAGVRDTGEELKIAIAIVQSHSSDPLSGLPALVGAHEKLLIALAALTDANAVAVDLQAVYIAYFKAANRPLHLSVSQCLEREDSLKREVDAKKVDVDIAYKIFQSAHGPIHKLECIRNYLSAEVKLYNAQMDLLAEIIRCVSIMKADMSS